MSSFLCVYDNCIHCLTTALTYIICLSVLVKIAVSGAGKMAQCLRAVTALPEILSSIPSNCMVAHNPL